MHVITLRKLREFWELHPDAEESLRRWHRITEKAHWQTLVETRGDFPHADLAGVCTIFNIREMPTGWFPKYTILVRCCSFGLC
jgi:mRNA interferase HigB